MLESIKTLYLLIKYRKQQSLLFYIPIPTSTSTILFIVFYDGKIIIIIYLHRKSNTIYCIKYFIIIIILYILLHILQ